MSSFPDMPNHQEMPNHPEIPNHPELSRYPDFDPANCKPYKCYQCTNKHTCEHGFKTYRIPKLEELSEYHGYGINRNMSSGPSTSNAEYGRYPPNQYTIPRRYYPYDYHLSRDMILMRLRNRRMNQ
ncbi:hypothetical protein ACKWTF_005529 [Chironomus riparius]